MTEPVKVDDSFFSKFDAGGEYLRSSDLLVDGKFKTFSLTIKEFFPAGSLKSADKKMIKNPVISFVEAKKLLILNSTNQEVLHLCTGFSDGGKTVGSKVIVEARLVEAFGDECLGLRLMPFPKTLIRKGLKKHLGKKAVWEGVPVKQEDGESESLTEISNAETKQVSPD